MDFIMTIVEQGLIYGILTLGIYITYKIMFLFCFWYGFYFYFYFPGYENDKFIRWKF